MNTNFTMSKLFGWRINNRVKNSCWIIILLLIISATVQAQLPILYYDFENNTTRTTFENLVEQQINAGNSVFSRVGTGNLINANGAGITLHAGTAAGKCIGGDTWPTSSGDPGIGATKYLQFSFSTAGFQGCSMTYDIFTGTTINYPEVGLLISTDGGASFAVLGSPFLNGTNVWTAKSINLPAAADDNANVVIRFYGYWSSNSTTDYFLLDNVSIFANGTVANTGTRTMLHENNYYTSVTSGTTGSVYNRTNFTVRTGTNAIIPDGSSVAFTGTCTVNSGGTLTMGGQTTGAAFMIGTGTFTLASGGTIGITSTAGITSSGATGNIQTTTRNFNTGGNYIYQGITGNQPTGNGLPSAFVSPGSVTINNTSGATLSQATSFATGTTLFITKGAFTNGALLSMNNGSTINRDGGTLSSIPTFSPTINVIYSGTITVTTGNELPTGTANLNNLTVSKTSGSVTLNANCTANGSFSLTGGTFIQNSGTNTFGLTINGDFNLSGGSYNFHSGSTQSTMTLNGNFVETGTGATTTSGSLNGIVLFNKTGTQTFSAASPSSLQWIQYNIASVSTLQLLTNMPVYGSTSFPSSCQVNGTLDSKTFTVTSQATGCTFALNANSTLITANTNGVFSGTAGSVSNTFTTKTFDNNASYNFNGTSAQTTNFFNSTMKNLTINNSTGVNITASSNPVVNGTLALTAGALSIGTNTLTLSGPITTTSGALGGTTSSNLTVNNTGTITGNVSFATGGQQLNDFILNRTGTTFILGTNLSVSGNWTNNGTFNVNAKVITFNGTSNQSISGSGATAFAALTINAGTSIATVVEALGTGGGAISNTGTLTLTNGLYRLTASNSSAFRSGSLTVAGTAGLELNGGSFSETGGTMTNNGLFRIVTGNASVGNASGNALDCSSTGTVDMLGGTLSVAARMRSVGGQINVSGTTITLNTAGLSNASRAVLEMDGATDFNWSNGSIILQNVNSAAGGEVNIASGTGTKTITGGTLQFGNASTGSGLTFRCNSAIDQYNVVLNSTNAPSVSLSVNNLTVKNILSLNGGTISTGSFNVIIPAGGTVSRTAGHVNGNLKIGFNTGAGQNKTFDIGDATTYAPVQLTNLNVSGAGDITGFTGPGTNPSENSPITNSSGINQSARANRYWTMTSSGGFSMSTADATFNFSAGEATGTPVSYVVRKYDPSAWATTTAGTMTATSSQCTGLSSFSEFEVGEINSGPGITCPSNITQCDNPIVTFTPSTTGSPVPSVTCNPTSGSSFSVGTTSVSCTATNINGSANCSFNVTINQSPVIGSCPSNITQCDNHVATWTDPTATGSPTPTVVCSPLSGSTFAAGTTTVNCTASNSCGSSSCSFTVTINESPVIGACPSNITQCDNHIATWTDPTATGTPIPTVVCSPLSGSTFATGTTTVTCTATNSCGSSNCSFTVTINESPVIGACPSNISQCDNYVATWTDPTAMGSPTPTVVCSPLSGSTFAAGTTTVTCTASNSCGYSSCSFTVTINESPIIGACPSNITQCDNHIATWTDPTATGTPTPTVVCSPLSGSTFATGTTTVTCTATNSCGSSSCSFTVTINESPVIGACPSNISQCDNYVATWTDPTATGSPTPTVVCSPLSGSTFAAGTTTVNCTATNSCGSSSCSFTVIINESPVIGACPSNISQCGNHVATWTTPSATGTSTPTVVCSPVSGSTFVTGTTTVTCTATNSCNSSSCTFTVTIDDPATAPASVTTNDADNEICSSGAITLTAVGGAFGSTTGSYKWYEGGCGTGPVLGSSVSLVRGPGLSVGTHVYYVRIEDGCGNTNCASVSVLVSGAPPTTNLPFPTVPAYACNGNNLTASTGAVTNVTTYTWDGPTGTTFNSIGNPYSSGSTSITVNYGAPNGSGYNICVQGSNACGTTTRRCNFVRGTVNVPGTITPANARTVECANTSASYSITAVTGATGYTWSITGNATVIGSGTNATVNFGAGWTGGNLCVTANTPCYSSAQRCLALTNSIAAPGAISGPVSICPGGPAQTYSVPVAGGAATYNWVLPPNTSGSSSSNSISVTFLTGYTAGDIKVSITSICGVLSAQKTKTVSTGIPTQPASVSGNASGLCNQTQVFSCPSVTGASSYTWTTPGTINSGQGSTSINVTFGAFSNGNVCVTANNGCGSSTPRCIPVVGKPAVSGTISYSPGTICANTPGVDFQINPVFGTAGYNWNFPAGVSVVLDLGNEQIVNWGTNSGVVSVTAANACGNTTKTVNITLGCRETNYDAPDFENKVIVYPNPAHDRVTVQFTSVENTNYVLNLLDLSGRVINTIAASAQKGINTRELDLSMLAKGVYVIEVKSNLLNKQIRIVTE